MSTPINLRDPRERRGIHKDFHPVLRAADEMQWVGIRSQGRSGIILRSPDGHSTIYVPGGKQDTTLRGKLLNDLMAKTPQKIKDDYLAAAEKVRVAPRPDPVVTKVVEQKHADPETETVVAEPVSVLTPEPTIVSERPYISRHSGGRMYESPAIRERLWSDGKKDYQCAFPGCGRVYTDHRPLSGHWKGHSTKEHAPMPPRFALPNTDPDDTDRVKRLAREIRAALEALDVREDEMFRITPANLAERVADFIVEKRRERGEVHDPEPKTPEDIVARIRALVMPDILSNQQALEQQVTELSASLAEQQGRVVAAEARATHYKDTLATFASLARDELGGADDGGRMGGGTPAPAQGGS